MFSVIIYGPKGSGKTHNADAFLRYYGKTLLLDTGLDGRKVPKSLNPNTLALTVERPRGYDGATLIHVDDAMRALGQKPFRLTSASATLAEAQKCKEN